FKKAFTDRCSQAIYIIGNNSHEVVSKMECKVKTKDKKQGTETSNQQPKCFYFYYRQMIIMTKEKNTRIIPPKVHVYLEGPKSRSYELGFALKVFRQFNQGIKTPHFVGPCITVFGSARFK